MTRYRYSHPGNEDEFEDFCVRFYCHWLKRSGLVRYAKRGEGQTGIDIVDQFCMKPVFAIQCKHREPTKTIRPKEIEDEVSQLELSSYPVDRYIIATTAKKSKNAQDTVLRLNQRESRRFEVEIDFWEEICTRLNEFDKAVAEFIFDGKRSEEESLTPVQYGTAGYAAAPADSANEIGELYSEIDTLFKIVNWRQQNTKSASSLIQSMI